MVRRGEGKPRIQAVFVEIDAPRKEGVNWARSELALSPPGVRAVGVVEGELN